jgi:archaemetzincin
LALHIVRFLDLAAPKKQPRSLAKVDTKWQLLDMIPLDEIQPGPQISPLVEVVPLGKLRPMAAEVAAAHLQAIYNMPARVMPHEAEPRYAVIAKRGQYDAGLILLELAGDTPAPPLRLGITAVDLCLPFLTHVFGEAQLEGRSAVVSLHRLSQTQRNRPVSRPLVLERLAKVALHEIAHVLGLVHCEAQDCLMNFSADLSRLDGIGMSLCSRCHKELQLRRRLLESQPSAAT